ncbi:hypothetical protein SDC9_164964 [bioreactor metagenome]|uniref:Uncharacterized protein n=1 Tax=bioreactor metagenome TaxID=1076179 RepID=A0A645FVP6_9ZZZZ
MPGNADKSYVVVRLIVDRARSNLKGGATDEGATDSHCERIAN